MMLQTRAASAAGTVAQDAATPTALSRPLGQQQQQQQEHASCGGGGGAGSDVRATVDEDILRAELTCVEQEHAASTQALEALQRRCDARDAALREMTATAGALYGRGLYALELDDG